MATGVIESTGRFQKGIWRCYWKVNSLCFTSRELEGLLIEYLDPKLIWWHDLTPQYNHISKTQDISNWKRGIFSLIWKMLRGFQPSIRSTKACLATLNNKHATPNFTACWWILLSFFPSYLNSYFVAFWRYINKTKHTKPKLFGNHSHETWTIATAATKSLEQVKLQSEENKKTLHKIPGLFYPLQKARIWLTAVNYKWHASTQHLATSNPFEMENCTASDLWTERVKEQQLHPEQTWVPVPADLHFPFFHGPVQLKQS